MMNIGIRLIVDKENNKSYISIDGKIEDATKGEKEEVRDTLVEAFSKILGLEETKTAQVIDDFKPVEHADDAAEFLKGMDEIEEMKEVEDDWKERFENMESIEIGFGRFSKSTPYQILVELEDNGIRELNSLRQVFLRNADRFPVNKKKIAEIDRALKEYEEIGKTEEDVVNIKDSFDLKLKKLEDILGGEDNEEAIRKLCHIRGIKYEEVLEKREEDILDEIIKTLKEPA